MRKSAVVKGLLLGVMSASMLFTVACENKKEKAQQEMNKFVTSFCDYIMSDPDFVSTCSQLALEIGAANQDERVVACEMVAKPILQMFMQSYLAQMEPAMVEGLREVAKKEGAEVSRADASIVTRGVINAIGTSMVDVCAKLCAAPSVYSTKNTQVELCKTTLGTQLEKELSGPIESDKAEVVYYLFKHANANLY